MKLNIPKIIHQTYRTDRIPDEFVDFRNSWIEHHPGWEYRLWTDYENRQFIKNNYEWFLPVYDGYPENIMRIDAVRYFILDFFGGLYVDLDFQALKNLEPLLTDKNLVLGKEPYAHAGYTDAVKRNLDEIICNAFMASTPRNEFWKHLFCELVKSKDEKGVLDATGPYFLTNTVINYEKRERLHILEPEFLYPISNRQKWKDNCKELGKHKKIYAVHHWKGSWVKNKRKKRLPLVGKSLKLVHRIRKKAKYLIDRKKYRNVNLENSILPSDWKPADDSNLYIQCFDNGNKIFEGFTSGDNLNLRMENVSDVKLVSCLMVTKNRFDHARRAVYSFLNQTYKSKELIVVDDGICPKTGEFIKSLEKQNIFYVKLQPENKKLGELRNIAVSRSSGYYVTQWDDDDFSHPQRLSVQTALMHSFGADSCFLTRHQVIFPGKKKLFFSNIRIWEGSFICKKKSMPEYQILTHGEDTPAAAQIFSNTKSVLLDYPPLYTYMYHSDNTFSYDHFNNFYKSATEIFECELFQKRLESVLEENLIDRSEFYRQYKTEDEESIKAFPYIKKTYSNNKRTDFPEVLILTPVKNVKYNLPLFFRNLSKLTYPHDKLSLGILESDSDDGTYEYLKKFEKELSGRFSDFTLLQKNFNYRIGNIRRWDPLIQLKRRAILAKSRNILLSQTLDTQKWVLWIDADLLDWPENIIEILLDTGKDIVVPHCVNLNGDTFDMNTFRLNKSFFSRNWKEHVINGLLQLQKEHGKTYLSGLRSYDCIEIDSVGGTMLFINADIHREGLVFPTFPYKYFIETEGLAMMAKDMGYKCWGLPNIETVHARD